MLRQSQVHLHNHALKTRSNFAFKIEKASPQFSEKVVNMVAEKDGGKIFKMHQEKPKVPS